MSDPKAAPPGWYPDPSGSGGERFWDGSHWHAGTRSVAVAAGERAAAGPAERGPGRASPVEDEPDVSWLREDEWLADDQADDPEDDEVDGGAPSPTGPGAGVAAAQADAAPRPSHVPVVTTSPVPPSTARVAGGPTDDAGASRLWVALAAVAAAVVVLVAATAVVLRGGGAADVTAASEPSANPRPPGASTTARPTATTAGATTSTTAAPTTVPTTAPPATTPVAPPTTAAALPSFGPGVKLVNREVAPGRYQTPGGPECTWSRLADLAEQYSSYLGRSSGGAGQVIVEILPTDFAFESEGCGTFVRYSPPPSPLVNFGDGTWAVNEQISPGRYQSTGAGECSWRRLADFRGVDPSYEGPGSVLAEAQVVGNAIVDILPTDVGFHAAGCGAWVRVG